MSLRLTLTAFPALAAFIVAFLPAFGWMSERFLERESYYSHGFLVPLVAAWLVGRRWKALQALPAAPSGAGLVLLAAALALHVLGGVVFGIGFLSGIALIAALAGLVWAFFGAAVLRAVAFPLAFLLFMVPVPQPLLISGAFTLKMAAAQAASWLVAQLGVPLVRAGSIIHLPNGTLTVGDECSGISSLISLLTLSVLFFYVAEKGVLRRAVLVCAALPVALAANIARISFLILAAHVYGTEAATQDVLHYGAGMVLWCSAVALLILLQRGARWLA